MNSSKEECPSLLGCTYESDASIFLQSGVLHAPVDEVMSLEMQGSEAPGPGAQNLSLAANQDDDPDKFDPIYDMYAGLILASFSLILLLMVNMLHDDGTTLGTPLKVKDEKGRSYLLDNAKFLLVAMVIYQHTFQITNFGFSRPFLGSWTLYLFNCVLGFDVRTLCFISGVVSRTQPNAEKVLITLLGPLIGFCFILAPLSSLMHYAFFANHNYAFFGQPPFKGGTLLQGFFTSGNSLQWYLVALIWWRILASLLQRFSPCMRVFMACLFAAMVSNVSTPFLSVNSLQLLPTFVVGQLFPYDQALSKLQWRPSTAMVGVATLAAIASFKTDFAAYSWVLYNTVNKTAGVTPFFWLRGLAVTWLELFRSIVFVFFVCPRHQTMYTEAGKNSLYPYLLQSAVLPWLGKAVELTPWLKNLKVIPLPWKVFVTTVDILVCGLVCFTLASGPVRCVFGWCLEPTWIKQFYVKGAEDNEATKT